MLRKWLCQADITIHLEQVDPLLIKSGYATVDGSDMVPVLTFRNNDQSYFLPGTSLKGVLRSHFECIARTLQPGSVCIPYYDPRKSPKIPVPVDSEQASYGCGYRGDHKASSSTAYNESCAACRLFGSLRFAGRFSIGDAYPLDDKKPQVEHRNGVGIDRFTGGTVRGVLFDLDVLVGGTFEAKLRITNFEFWQLAAVNLLLSDLRDEMISVGSGRSRGLGRVKGKVTSYRITYLNAVPHVKALAGLATQEEREAYELPDWQPDSPISLADPRVLGLRHEYDCTKQWTDFVIPLAPALEHFLQWHGGPKETTQKTSQSAKQEG